MFTYIVESGKTIRIIIVDTAKKIVLTPVSPASTMASIGKRSPVVLYGVIT
jgi:hypothetical protein